MANLDRIVNVQIALDTAGISKEGFSTLMVVGASEHLKSRVTTYTNVTQLTKDGFPETDPVYLAVADAFSQTPRPRLVKVGRRDEGESIAQTMAAVMGADSDFYGIVLASRQAQDVKDMATWAETQTKLFGTSIAEDGAKDAEATDDLASWLVSQNLYRTFWYYHKDATADYPEAAIFARCFSIDPGGETWALKKLAGVTADDLTETEYNAITKKNGNTFEKFRNLSITQNGKVAAGEWIDVIRFRDWLQEEITTNVFTLLTNRDKVPYTDAGIALIEAQIRAALELGQARGGIAPTEYDEDGNANLGYTISVPLASSISFNQKASRVLTDVEFTARLAGAIHAVDITGHLTYENLTEA